ncbi:MAG: RNA polymerase sigma factor [Mucilaginibacter sp.]
MQNDKILPNLFKTEYRKIVSVLYRHFGFEHPEIAEDIASDTFLTAAETWGLKGFPDNPVAWLYRVAGNKAKDHLKHSNIFEQKVTPGLQMEQPGIAAPELDLSDKNIFDSQLQMLFAICNPVIPAEAQIGLALRILCGFGIDEIADAFLTNKETINKRLFRAKEKLREEKVKIGFPENAQLGSRIANVLKTLYLLFNEGYYSSGNDNALRKELCLEAMRLNYFLVESEFCDLPEVNALLALMCFHTSRFDARIDKNGEMIRYHEQDTRLWNKELIQKGEFYLNRASKGFELSKYHCEASIAYWHTIKEDTHEKWDNILQLYNRLLIIEYSPIAALNRTYALSKVYGKEAAIVEAEKLQLNTNHLYFLLLGNLYRDINNQQAVNYLHSALKLARTAGEKKLIKKDIDSLNI